MKSKLLVPKIIHVGFQRRRDTYTGQLAYVVYEDHEGTIKKRGSWESWRDKKIQSAVFENEPTSGFVLNKKVGDGGGWRHARKAWFRTYDPRGFEFEISAANLVFILQECTSVKGKGLEGEFVYAWDRQQLVLLPVDSQEYRDSVAHTQRQSMSIDPKDLQEGFVYRTKDNEELLYLGYHRFYHTSVKTLYDSYRAGYHRGYETKTVHHKAKRHIFVNAVNPCVTYRKPKAWSEQIPYLVVETKKLGKLICERVSDDVSPKYADAYESFAKSKWGSQPQVVKKA